LQPTALSYDLSLIVPTPAHEVFSFACTKLLAKIGPLLEDGGLAASRYKSLTASSVVFTPPEFRNTMLAVQFVQHDAMVTHD
jgi:hypothetical protein